MSRDCFVALPRGAMGLFAVCDCGISWSYSPTFFERDTSMDKCLIFDRKKNLDIELELNILKLNMSAFSLNKILAYESESPVQRHYRYVALCLRSRNNTYPSMCLDLP